MSNALSVAPGPASTEIEFPDSIGRCIRIVKSLRGKYDSKLLKEPVQRCTAAGQPRKFDSVPVHILKNGAFARYDEFSQSLQIVHLATDKLDQFMCVIDRARVDDHSEIIPGRISNSVNVTEFPGIPVKILNHSILLIGSSQWRKEIRPIPDFYLLPAVRFAL